MLVNFEENQTDIVQFISYSGKYPNLCRGVLTLKIEGEIVKFGHDFTNYKYETGEFIDNNYDEFWTSGGSCFFLGDYEDEVVNTDEWVIDAEKIPEKYRKYAPIIDKVFNDNVEYGCCGGCL